MFNVEVRTNAKKAEVGPEEKEMPLLLHPTRVRRRIIPGVTPEEENHRKETKVRKEEVHPLED